MSIGSTNKPTIEIPQYPTIEIPQYPTIEIPQYPTTPSITSADQNSCCQKLLAKLRHWPWFIWFISIVEILVFIAELGQSWSLTGSPIQIKPSFNPLIGPSSYVLIYMGARFAPCMYAIKEITDDSFLRFPCPNYTGSADQDNCTLNELCGFGGVSSPPNQWYRFIIPIFLHGGLLHIFVNVFTQLIMGISIEKKIGSLKFAIIYFISGIFGNIVSGNFAPNGSASVGCSGSLFGIIALFLLNLILDWHNTSCGQFICFIICIVIDIGLGLLPIIDNFSHIGGFIMGFLLGLALFEFPARHRRQSEDNPQERSKKFFHIRLDKWWILRFVVLGIAIDLFVVLMLNIYLWGVRCTWCQYINCLPINDWCDIGHLNTMDTTNSTRT
jgi:membrane associated rhomboid family serine protease